MTGLKVKHSESVSCLTLNQNHIQDGTILSTTLLIYYHYYTL